MTIVTIDSDRVVISLSPWQAAWLAQACAAAATICFGGCGSIPGTDDPPRGALIGHQYDALAAAFEALATAAALETGATCGNKHADGLALDWVRKATTANL